MIPARHDTIRRCPRRRGFTLLEMLLAAGLTAAACTAATMLIKTINDTAATSNGVCASTAESGKALSCLDLLVSQAQLIGFRDDNRVLIWRCDENENGQVNLQELTLLRYNETDKVIELVDVRFSPNLFEAILDPQNILLTLGQFGSAAGALLVEQHANVSVRQLLGGVTSFRAWTDAAGVAARMLQITFTVEREDGEQVFTTVLTPRSPAWSLMP